MNKLWLLIPFMFLQACSFLRPAETEPLPLPLPPVKVITETVQLEIYQPPLPPEIQLDDVQWFVVTKENLEDKIAEVENYTGTDFVVFGMTPQSYENMAYNLQEIRRYIRQQTEIIKYYREATKPKGPAGWLEENQEQQNTQLEIEQSDNETTNTIEFPETTEDKGFFSRLLPSIGN
jgi:hypothetical protein